MFRACSFFGAFHGVLQATNVANPGPESHEINIAIASVSTLSPLVAVSKLRPMLPYACILIVLDIINGINAF